MAMKKKLEKNSNTQLPEDIAVQILSRLPVQTLIRFSCVSKRWSCTLSHPQFAKSQFKSSSARQTLCPRLLVPTASQLHSVTLNDTTSFDDNSPVRELTCPFKQPGHRLLMLGSCNGLVCVALDFHENYYIWNPTTGFFLRLPDPNFSSRTKNVKGIYNYGFGYVSATDDYKVIVAARLNDQNEDGDPVEVFSLRALSWERVDCPTLSSQSRGALSNEALHWLHSFHGPFRHGVLAFDLAKEEFREVALPVLNGDDVEFGQLGVLLEGFLCVVSQKRPDSLRRPREVWVMRDYNVWGSWSRIFGFEVSERPAQTWFSSPMFIRESGVVVMQSYGFRETELMWFDKKEDKFEKDVVCGRQYRLEGSPCLDNVVEYVETLLPLFSKFSVAEQTPPVEIPVQHLITVQQTTGQNISSMVPLKLTRANFTQWKWLFLPVLRKYGVQGLVDGTETCPPAFLLDNNGNITNRVNPAFEKWIDQDQSVMIWLNSRISEELLPYTVRASSARALWLVLEELFADASHSYFS